MAKFELEVDNLSSRAFSVLRAAVKRARDNPALLHHSVLISELCRLARIPHDTPASELRELVKELKNAIIVSHDFAPGEYSGWLAFESIAVTQSHLEFTLCHHALDATEPRELLDDKHMSKLNEGLKIALALAGGDAEAFAFQLTATLGAYMGEGGLEDEVAWPAIKLLHQLHPSISL